MAQGVILPKFYTDKHIPKAAVRQLQSRGVNIVRCEDVGMGDASDIAHLEYATREGRVVITKDTDFLRLDDEWQAEGKQHPGIMFCGKQVKGLIAVSKIVDAVMLYYELIEGGPGTVEADIVNHLLRVK